MEHTDEFRRCLIEADVAGMQKISAHANPHHPPLSPAEALVALHMARCEAKSIPRRLKIYSTELLKERGYIKVRGNWTYGPPTGFAAETVMIASKSADPSLAKKITTAMRDALLNVMAKGVMEPPMQREVMLKARAKVRRRAALD